MEPLTHTTPRSTTVVLLILSTSFVALSFLISFSSCAQQFYVSHYCDDTTVFKSNSTYQSNLNILLFSLSSNSNNPYLNATISQSPNTVYGHYYCRGDITRDVCRDCVKSAATDIVQRCPDSKIGYIWYEMCTLRYSNHNFFSTVIDAPVDYLWNEQNVSDPTRFNHLLVDTVNKVATTAASDSERFGTRDANFSQFQKLYCLAQCSPDISRIDCNRCLLGTIAFLPSCCSGKIGGRVLNPSCNIRFEMFPFYRVTASAPAPLPPPSGYVLISAESLQFDFSTILEATNNFANINKIGEGGFGSVYKGKLPNGQEIAVKRLSIKSMQGAEEFMNEVVLVAKLQHRNLVRLLGFCLEGDEKILIYEFVPNKSLDYFLFDSEKCMQLDWQRRYKIVEGIARGLLYLHEDSHLRIIHRDLKASNILLNEEMNPKISDFGLARIFGEDQAQAKTSRIVGTYGYMCPEYAMRGQFSVKSDVFSFGVLVLEIVNGKNSSYYQTDGTEDLISYAWRHWNAGTAFELIDPILREDCSRSEVMKCIHIGLLCVQEVTYRPTMANVVVMLNSYRVTLPSPSQPALFLGSDMESGEFIEGEEMQKLNQNNLISC
ncbi:cysteine-rich receptor-like protein kinase 10 isoform X2 [Macadamia integrifolia]|uniref:cysteine-rich receptor-like protein kinase 10 isoform X2 n=1 Tax=Macadamia integrifolia TaxID=60698 RepID=UPI001C533D86|nr:cysteine-rich receptor-like protein kinase 10 isoform X2 [Macadamia integrifolia]